MVSRHWIVIGILAFLLLLASSLFSAALEQSHAAVPAAAEKPSPASITSTAQAKVSITILDRNKIEKSG